MNVLGREPNINPLTMPSLVCLPKFEALFCVKVAYINVLALLSSECGANRLGVLYGATIVTVAKPLYREETKLCFQPW